MKGEALHNDWMDYLCRIMAFSDQNLTPKTKQIKLYICISIFKLKLFCITVSNQQYFTSMREINSVQLTHSLFCKKQNSFHSSSYLSSTLGNVMKYITTASSVSTVLKQKFTHWKIEFSHWKNTPLTSSKFLKFHRTLSSIFLLFFSSLTSRSWSCTSSSQSWRAKAIRHQFGS